MNKKRRTFTLSPNDICLLERAKRKTGNSMSEILSICLKKQFADKRKELREELKKHRHSVARITEEWNRLFPDEDIAPDEL